jgi:hypothetical protein
MGKKLAEVLEQSGMPLHVQVGGLAPEELVEREVKREPGPRARRLRELYYRGSFPMPWLSEGYYMAREDDLYQAALAKGSASAGEVSRFGSGGGNVTRDFGSVVSIAGKFGIRQEEVPAMLQVARAWVGKSVDDLGHKCEQMVPGYEVEEAIAEPPETRRARALDLQEEQHASHCQEHETTGLCVGNR